MARSEICKSCCPSGGALFDVAISKAYMACDLTNVPDTIARYVKRCRNCGAEKPMRWRQSAKKKAAIARREAMTQNICAE